MGLTSVNHSIEIGDTTVAVTAKSGLVHATWRLVVDGSTVDEAAAAGDFTLRGTLPDGTAVAAEVHQSLLGPTEVAVVSDGTELGRFSGFVA